MLVRLTIVKIIEKNNDKIAEKCKIYVRWYLTNVKSGEMKGDVSKSVGRKQSDGIVFIIPAKNIPQ